MCPNRLLVSRLVALPRQRRLAGAAVLGLLCMLGLQDRLAGSGPVLTAGLAAGVLGLQLYLPIWLCDRQHIDLQAIGLSGQHWRPALFGGLGTAAVCLPAYAVLSHWVLTHGAPLLGIEAHHWRPLTGGAVALAGQLPAQLLGVALPEEVFFRGYLQKQFKQRIGLTAGCFALAHVVGHQHLAGVWTFFPGLMFGWVHRRWPPSLVGCVVLHTLCNLFAQYWLGHYVR
jgi:membrane protease YdiL (CAAX protease family)